MQQRLQDMGDWLQINGEAIYGTRVWRHKPAKAIPGVFFTVKDNNLYVICTQWPQQSITIEGIQSMQKISLLGSDIPVKATIKGSLVIQPPAINPGNMPCQHAWVFKVENYMD
jgi:alpha-L-fucosidase